MWIFWKSSTCQNVLHIWGKFFTQEVNNNYEIVMRGQIHFPGIIKKVQIAYIWLHVMRSREICLKSNMNIAINIYYQFKALPLGKVSMDRYLIWKILPLVIVEQWSYMIWSRWISRLSAILILRYSPTKKTTSFVSYCFSKPTFTHISGTKCPILIGFSAKCSFCDVA